MPDYDVQYNKDTGDWSAKRAGASKAAGRYDSQADAHDAARGFAERSGGEMRDHRKDNNQIRNTDTIGKKDPTRPRDERSAVNDAGRTGSAWAAPAALADRLSEPGPTQRAFEWNRSKWLPVVHDAPDATEALEALPDRLDRAIVRDVVQANLTIDRVLAAFIPVLIWGGPGGYGPFRARSILTGIRRRANMTAPLDESIRQHLLAGANAVRHSGARESFRLMNNEGKVKYLGGAFFTKWIAFSSMVDSIDGPDVAPILDKRVSDWIAAGTAGEGSIRLSPRSTRDYRRYRGLLDSWGTPYGRSRAQVELAIFELTRDRPEAAPRAV
ncbi:DUF2188 domain-containing protein [Brevibacterium sp. K11IcPPYGO002]|uniref:DUF2188 domain-containing protein n=1 Tax=Brevibacterium sp. K11IcPPYGO002 TaxID=3058837 RepID=UPI003D815EEB